MDNEKHTYNKKRVANNISEVINHAVNNNGVAIEGILYKSRTSIEKALGGFPGCVAAAIASAEDSTKRTTSLQSQFVINAAKYFEIPLDILLFSEIKLNNIDNDSFTLDLLIESLIRKAERLIVPIKCHKETVVVDSETSTKKKKKANTEAFEAIHYILPVGKGIYADVFNADKDASEICVSIYDKSEGASSAHTICTSKDDEKLTHGVKYLYRALKKINCFPVLSAKTIRAVAEFCDFPLYEHKEDSEVIAVDNFKYLMKKKHISQKTFCRMFNISTSFYSKESKTSKIPQLKTLIDVANYLDITVATLAEFRLDNLGGFDDFYTKLFYVLRSKTEHNVIKWGSPNYFDIHGAATLATSITADPGFVNDSFKGYQHNSFLIMHYELNDVVYDELYFDEELISCDAKAIGELIDVIQNRSLEQEGINYSFIRSILQPKTSF